MSFSCRAISRSEAPATRARTAPINAAMALLRLLCVAGGLAGVDAAFSFSSVFGDRMVLQREIPSLLLHKDAC